MSIFSLSCEFWFSIIIFMLGVSTMWGIGNLNNYYCLLLLFIKYQDVFLIMLFYFLSFPCFCSLNLGWGVSSYCLCQSKKSSSMSKSYKSNEIVVFGFDLMCYFYLVFDHNGYWAFEFYVYFNESLFSYNKLYYIFFNLYSQVIGLLNSFVVLMPEEEFDETDCKYLAMNINQFLFFQMVSYQEPQGILNGFYHSDSDLSVVSLIWGSSFCFYKFLESLFLLKIFMCLFYPMLKNPDWSSTNVFIYLLHTLYLADKKYFSKGVDYELMEIVNQLMNYECDSPSMGLMEKMYTFSSYLSNFFMTSGDCYHGMKVGNSSGFSKFFLHSILNIPVSSYFNYKYRSFWEDCKYFFSYKEIHSSGLVLLETGKASGCNYFIYNIQSGFFVGFSFLVFENIFNMSSVLLVVSLYEKNVMDCQYGEYGSAKSFLMISDLSIQILGVSVMGASPLGVGGGLEASESYINSTNQPSDLKGVLFDRGKVVQKEEEKSYLAGMSSKMSQSKSSSCVTIQSIMEGKMKSFVKLGNMDGFESLYTNTDLGCQGSLHFTHKGLQGELFDMKLTKEEHSSMGFCQVMNFLDEGVNSPYMGFEKEEFMTLSLGFKYLFSQGFCAKLSMHSYDEVSFGGKLLKDSLYGVHYSSGGLSIQKEEGVSLVSCLCSVKDSVGFYSSDSCIAGCENCCSLMNKYFYMDSTGVLQLIKSPLVMHSLPGSASTGKPLFPTQMSYSYLDVLSEFYFYFYNIFPLLFSSVKFKEKEMIYKGIKMMYGYKEGNLEFSESDSQPKVNMISGECVFEIFLKYLKKEYGSEEVFFSKINYNMLHLESFESALFGQSEEYFSQFYEVTSRSTSKNLNKQKEEGEKVFFNYGVVKDETNLLYNTSSKMKKLHFKMCSLLNKDTSQELTPLQSMKLTSLEKNFEDLINSYKSLDHGVMSSSKMHRCLLEISSSSHFYTSVGGPMALEYKMKDCLPVKPSMDQFFSQDAGSEEYILKFKEYLTSWSNMENYLSDMEFEKEMSAFKSSSVFKSTLLVCSAYRSSIVKWSKK